MLDDIKDIEKYKLGKEEHVTYGQAMPVNVDQEEQLCPPAQETCKTCAKCTYTDIMGHVHVQRLNVNNNTWPPQRSVGTFNQF